MAGRFTTRQKWIIGIGSAVVGSIVVFMIVRQFQKKFVLKRINAALGAGGEAGGAGSFGDYQEMKTMPAFDANFYKTSALTSITSSEARAIAKRIYAAVYQTFMTEDEDAIIAEIKKLKNQADISKVAYQYNSQYKKDLYQSIQASLSDTELAEMWRIVKTKPYQ